MQYIKRNGVVELERIQNALKTQEVDVQTKKKDVYAKIYQERMANKNKKRSKSTVLTIILFNLDFSLELKCQSINDQNQLPFLINFSVPFSIIVAMLTLFSAAYFTHKYLHCCSNIAH